MVWANVVNAVLGIWFVVAPFVLGFSDRPTAMWASIVGGAVLLVLAGWAAFDEKIRHQAWVQYVNGLVGIWFIIFTYVYTDVAGVAYLRWTTIAGGVIAAVLCAWLVFGVLPREAHA